MGWRSRAVAVLREPLVHFMVAGALVFALLAGRVPDVGDRKIVVNEALVARLADRFSQNFRRPPSPTELDGLINDYVKSQIYYREALRLGLDKDDDVVMRRMRNKMIAIATSDADAATPSDADLQALLDQNPARYAGEADLTFTQLYLGADNPSTRANAAAALKSLQGGGAADRYAQPAPLPGHYDKAPASDIAGAFGEQFAATLPRLPHGQWAGPIASGLGLHLVRVEAVGTPAPPSLEQARQQLANDWHEAAVSKAEDTAYRKMLSGYDVVIEQPK